MGKVDRFLFVDVETSGLDPSHDDLLEIGLFVTDGTFSPLAAFHALIQPERLDLGAWDPWSVRQHGSILHLLLKAEKWEVVRQRAANFCAHWLPDGSVTQLAGSSVHFDIECLFEHGLLVRTPGLAISLLLCPDAPPSFHHRRLDTSVLVMMEEMAMSGHMAMRRASEHRVLPDIAGCMDVLSRRGPYPYEAQCRQGRGWLLELHERWKADLQAHTEAWEGAL